MTAQAPDTVVWSGTDWSLVGIDGSGLFDPTLHGLEPVATSTANWRGFVCHYAVENERLTLAELEIGLAGEAAELAADGQGPLLAGHVPSGGPGGWTYRDLALPVDFTGRLLLGDGFIWDLYVHMGFHPAWKYERVTELVLEGGALVDSDDLSARYAELREQSSGEPLSPPPDSTVERVRDWIATTFDRTYRD